MEEILKPATAVYRAAPIAGVPAVRLVAFMDADGDADLILTWEMLVAMAQAVVIMTPESRDRLAEVVNAFFLTFPATNKPGGK
jgi:hypothetical protein